MSINSDNILKYNKYIGMTVGVEDILLYSGTITTIHMYNNNGSQGRSGRPTGGRNNIGRPQRAQMPPGAGLSARNRGKAGGSDKNRQAKHDW